MKKIGVGIIGAGWISNWHIKGYKSLQDKVELLAIADTNKERAKEVAKKNGIKYVFTNYKELLKLEEIEAINITTPTFLHKEMVIDAAKAGKNILCEKPFALNIEESEEMVKVARENKIFLMPGHNRLFFPPHRKVKEMIDKGKIGEPKIFQGNFINGSYASSNFLQSNWRSKKERGRGAVLESAVHEIYVIEKLMGRIKSVMAYIAYRKGLEVDTENLILLEIEKRRLANITLSLEAPFIDDMEIIIGEKGVILISGVEWPRFHHPYLGLYSKEKKSWEFLEVDFNWDQSFINMISHFIACIKGEEKPLVTAYDGRDTIAIVEAVYRSEKEGKRVKVERGVKNDEDIF